VCGDSAGQGRILRSVARPPSADFWRTTVPPGTPAIRGICFPGTQQDTGYAVGDAGTVLKTTDKGIPWLPGVAESRVPAVKRAGIRVMSNPCRRGIALHSDAEARVLVFDAAGRAVVSRTAAKGASFLPLPTGAYFLQSGIGTARAVVTD
jgi:hypothetical protein